jgi:hypothetical protein
VHLRNCPRCVEHERRLVQATDWLMAGVPSTVTPAPLAETPTETEPPAEAPPAAEEPPVDGPEDAPPAHIDAAPAPAPAPGPARAPAIAPDGLAPPAEMDAAPAPTPDDVAAAAEVLVTVRTRRQIAAAVAWNSMVAIAILLALVTIGLTIAGIMGAEL